jgi:prefoldin subunit 5
MQQQWQGAQPGGFDRLTFLKNQAEMLQRQLENIQAQIKELENK